MSELTDRLSRLTPAQRALIDKRLKGARSDTEAMRIKPRSDRDHALTVDQERIWLIHQFDPHDPVYNVFFAARFTGPLNRTAVQQAVDALTQRHESLRTTFSLIGGSPRAIVHETMCVTVSDLDLRAAPGEDREQLMLTEATAETRRCFDLEHGPLFRLLLIQTGDQEHVLVFTVDHLVWDRASVGIFDTEFAELYSAAVEERTARLTDITHQYGDYAEWQRSWLAAGGAAEEIAYWKAELNGAPPALNLPLDFQRPATRSFTGARHTFRLTPDLSKAVRTMAKKAGVTVNVAFLATWSLLLSRMSAQNDIVVGATASTRVQPETEQMIGYFLTMLPLRIRIDPTESFLDLMRRTNTTQLRAFDHCTVPFGTLMDTLNVERDPSRNPVYQTTFIMVDFVHEEEDQLAGLETDALMLDNGTAKDDITLGMFDDKSLGEDHYYGLIEYNSELFSPETIGEVARRLVHILEQLTAAPASPVHEIDVLTTAEREAIAARNNTPVPRDSTDRVDQRIWEQAVHSPNAIAVTDDRGSLTYEELLRCADSVAQRLREVSAGDEPVVGVLVERDRFMPPTLLGVWAAGAAYLPLDSAYPPARIAEIATLAGVSAIVCGPEQRGLLEDLLAVPIVDQTQPDSSTTKDLTEIGERLPARAAHQLAYVIYTSGSTGTPKGVEIEHASLLNLLEDLTDRLEITAGDSMAALTPVTFDIAGLELWGPLIRGARVRMIAKTVAQDGRQLAQLLDREEVGVVQATPATWHLLLAAGWRNAAKARILVGGEALSQGLASDLHGLPGAVWNVYGPTETTIWSSVWLITEPVEAEPPIGYPVSNTQLHVLDEWGGATPTNAIGELFIGGVGLARGYRGDPSLTAERFVHHPQLGRLYRTGDRAARRRDGVVEFHGRADGQVKVRGHRIELGEIEKVLERHPDVQRAVALVAGQSPMDHRIVAFVEAFPGTSPAVAVLRAAAREALPEYAVPTAIGMVREWPLTAHGKVDRKMLADTQISAAGVQYQPPRDELELAVATVWADVLGVERVGIGDNFFDLGGHSLLVLRLVSDLEARFEVSLPMAAIFQGATVEAFAKMIRDGAAPHDQVHLVPLAGTDANGRPLFLLHPAGSEVACYMPLAQRIGSRRPVYAVASPDLVEKSFGFETFEERAEAFAALIRSAQPEGPYGIAGWCYGGSSAYATAAVLERDGATTSVTLIDSHPPVIVEETPSRAEIIFSIGANMQWDRISEEDHVLRQLESMTAEEQTNWLLDLAREAGYLSVDSGRAQIESVIETWEANLHLVWRYRPTPIRGPVTLIHADQEDPQEVSGWSKLSVGNFKEVTLPGNHYTVMREPFVAELAELLAEDAEALR